MLGRNIVDEVEELDCTDTDEVLPAADEIVADKDKEEDDVEVLEVLEVEVTVEVIVN